MTRFARLALLALVTASMVLSGAPPAHALLQPTLVSTTPGNGASVQAAPEISATYDTDLHPTSTIVLRDSSNDPIAGTGSVSGRTVRFTPTEPITEEGSPYSVTATVRDFTNTLQTVTTWTFSIDKTKPAAPTIASVEGDTTSPALGNDTTPTIMVSGVTAGDTVRILEGATVLGSKQVDPEATTVTFNAGESDRDVTLTGEAAHSLTATASDPAANVSDPSSPFVYALDTSAPGQPTITAVEGDTASPAAGNDVTPTIVVSGVSEGDEVTILEGTTERGSKVVPPGADTVTFNAAETDGEVSLTGNGDHALTAVATDPPGNQSEASLGFVYTLDTTAPATPTIASVSGDTTSPAAGNDPTPTIVVSGVTAGDTVKILEGTTVLGSKQVEPGATTVTFNAAAGDTEVNLTSDGDHSLTAVAADPVGNASAASAPFVYRLDTGNAGPTLVSTSPGSDAQVQPPATVSATYDEPLDPTKSVLSLRNKAGNLVSGSSAISADGKTITFTPASALSEAGSPYTATAVVKDVNANETTSRWSFTIDTTAPVAPAITNVEGDSTSPAAGTDTTPTILVSDVSAGDTVRVLEGDTVLGSKVVPAGDTTVTFNADEAARELVVNGIGNHTLVATTTDRAGNLSPASAPFVYSLVSFDGTFHPLTPARILDTRSTTKVGPGATRDLTVTGAGGVPATGVSAVVVN
ncbi:MAG: Ig-like domain-containing protein, partial [Actinomycetota bacterium]|nr:Ig-like domain-containing protein [Actinomycetota bacterium]